MLWLERIFGIDLGIWGWILDFSLVGGAIVSAVAWGGGYRWAVYTIVVIGMVLFGLIGGYQWLAN